MTAYLGRAVRFSGTMPLAGAGLVTGLLLLFLALPRALSSFLVLPAEDVLEKVLNQENVSVAELSDAIAAEKLALNWFRSAENMVDLGFLQVLLALRQDDEELRGILLQEARKSLELGLTEGPGDAFAWVRLAYADYLLDGPSDGVVAALKMAIWTAPYQPRLIFNRLELCFLVWPRFAPHDRYLVYQQIRYAWQEDPKRLVELARRENLVELVRSSLYPTEKDQARFERLLQKSSY